MKRWLPSVAALAACVAAAVLWVAQCTGPKPQVADVRLQEPQSESDPYVVLATLHNTWRGQGEVRVTARLRDSGTGTSYEKEAQATLNGRESVAVAIEIHAPRGHYTPDVQAEYPPS